MNILVLGKEYPVIDAKGRHRGYKYWVICPVCEQGRWVKKEGTKRPRFTGMCRPCHAKSASGPMENHSNWKGGRVRSGRYMRIRLSREDFFYPMAGKGYVLEHRLVMAKALNRCLLPWEVVHHKNGVKTDNRFENLELLPGQHFHISDSILKSSLRKLNKTVIRQQVIIDELNKLLSGGKNG